MARRRSESDDHSSAVLSNRGMGSYTNLNKLVVWWTTVMILTVLIILSYFTMALITEVQNGSASENSRRLEDADQDDVADADDDGDENDADDDDQGGYNDDANGGVNDDYNNNAADDGGENDDGNQWGQDNYDDVDENYAVDDAISANNDDDWVEDGIKFSFSLNGEEIFFLLFLLVSVIALDYYGLEALKELGNRAARFRVGAFAAFLLMLANFTLVVAVLLGLAKSSDAVGGGLEGSNANAVAIFFLIMAIVYLIFGIALYRSEQSSLVSSDRREPLIEDSKRETANNLFILWIAIVVISGILIIISFVIAKHVNVSHQSHRKFHFALIWGTLMIIAFANIGWIVLRARGVSTKLLTGTFFGGLVGLSCLFISFFVYFTPLVYGRGKQEGVVTTAETTFSFLSLFLAIMFAAFSHTVYTYRHTIIKANAADSGLPTLTPLT